MAATDLSDLVRLVQFTGHYCDFEGCPRETLLNKLQFLRLLFMISVNPFALTSLFIGGLKNSMGIELFFGLMGFLTVMQHGYCYIYRKEVVDIVKFIKRFREVYQENSDEEFQGNVEMIWKVVRCYLYAMTGLLAFYITLPTFVDWVYGILWNDPVAHRVPLSLDGFLEEKQKRNLTYLIVSVTRILWSLVSAYSHFGLDALLCLVGFYYSSLVKTFCNRLRLDPDMTPEQTTARIRSIAAQQKELLSIALKIRDFFGFPYALQNLFGAFCLVSLLYALLSDDSADLFIYLVTVFNFMILSGMLSSTAYVGQHFTDENWKIRQSIYDMPWYQLKPSDRKYFITMLCCAREPLTIYFHGGAPLDFENFMAILNTAYGYFMFMKNVL